ncbi:hypothetical protein C8R48DRAFT_772563 [Suillus tomentosus]|nr:hypothetical protein C8R48DRAFT_772563 [Suillus tomentosus]
MPDLHVASEAKFQDVLSVPAQFSIAPSGSLSVAALLLINLPTVLENSALAARIVFSKQSPLLQLPTGNLLVDNESESYERGVLDDMTGLQSTADGSTEVEAEGRGKRRRVANTQYKDFWMH